MSDLSVWEDTDEHAANAVSALAGAGVGWAVSRLIGGVTGGTIGGPIGAAAGVRNQAVVSSAYVSGSSAHEAEAEK